MMEIFNLELKGELVAGYGWEDKYNDLLQRKDEAKAQGKMRKAYRLHKRACRVWVKNNY